MYQAKELTFIGQSGARHCNWPAYLTKYTVSKNKYRALLQKFDKIKSTIAA